jgi:ABC-type amino acid transport substrate-binding protein
MIAKRSAYLGWWLLMVGLVMLLAACGGGAAAPTEPAVVAEATSEPLSVEPTLILSTPTTITAPSLAVLSVGVNAQFKPFVYYDDQGRLVGFDVDLIDALADAGNFEFGYVDLPLEELLAQVERGEIDIAISAITITPERQALFNFSEPYFGQGQAAVSYFSGGQGMAVRVDNMTITGTLSLSETARVGVKSGTTGATLAAETPAEVVEFSEAEPALAALSAGEVEAVILDIPVIVNYIKTNPTAGIKLAGRPLTEEQYGIAISPTNSTALETINAALAQIQADGTFDAIMQYWFGSP